MNILYLHRTQGQGAAGNHIRQVVKAFRALGHNVMIVSPPGVQVSDHEPDSSSSSSWSQRLGQSVRLNATSVMFELFEILYNGIAHWRLWRTHRKARYDLIYERYAIFGTAGLTAARRQQVPLLLEVNFTSRTSVHPPRSRLFQKLAESIDRKLFSRADGIIVVSTVLKQHLIQEFGVPDGRILVVPNAVDPQEFAGASVKGVLRELPVLNGELIIGFVGGFYPWHGLELLIEAARRILTEEPKARFVMIGDGTLLESLRHRVKTLQLEEAVLFTGRVSREALANYIAAFDIGVMPDSNDYGSPMKILEYMAMGKPVVAPRLGPIEEIVDHEKEGVLFEPKSVPALSAAILGLLRDVDRRRRLGENGRRRVLEKHTWKQNARTVLAFYERQAKKGR